LLIVLVIFFGLLTTFVLRRTEGMQGRVEKFNTDLAERASDALGNVPVIQSFTRVESETFAMRRIIDDVLSAQMPVLSWWALAAVATRASATLTLVGIFLLGTWLHMRGLATIGEIVAFMSFATMLIGRLEQIVGFVNAGFLLTPKLQDFFHFLDTLPGVNDKAGAQDAGRLRGRVAFEHVHPERGELGFESEAVTSSYLDLRYGAVALALGLPSGKTAGSEGVSCVLVRPASDEKMRQRGKNVIALGGGRGMRVWLNGRKFFRSVSALDTVDPMERLLLLDRPLSEADRVEVLVCSRDSAETLGASLSFWSDREIDELCRSKGWKPPEGLALKQGWERISDYRETCFGSYIRRPPR
jgi:ABC-type multidrug transport system fused ATPase/permease subunit